MTLSLFIATLFYVALKAFQQRNVSGGHYLPLIPTSYGMAAYEVFIVSAIVAADDKVAAVVAMGTGGWVGCMIAVYLHKRLFKCKK